MSFLEPVIRAYSNTFSNGIFTLFVLISALQLYQGIQRLRKVDWTNYASGRLTRQTKQAAGDVAWVILVPISLLIHELGHAVAVKLYGGNVVEFGFFFYFGYVLPDRVFPLAVQEWWVSMAGTVGNILFALPVFFYLYFQDSTVLRYTAKRHLSTHVYFVLIFYPVFTLVASFGDWRTIYDFQATPMLAGITAVLHAGALLAYWYYDRQGWFEEVVFDSPAQQARYEQLSAESSEAAQLERVRMLLQGSAQTQAKTAAAQLIKTYPASASGHYLHGLSQLKNDDEVGRSPARSFEQALSLGLNNLNERALAHYLVALYQQRAGRDADALQNMTNALDTIDSGGHTRILDVMVARRAELHRRLGNLHAARIDMEHAIALAEQMGRRDSAEKYRQEMAYWR